MKATVDRTGDIPTARCPSCGTTNEFPDFAEIEMFLCINCGDLILVDTEEPKE